MFNRRLLSLAIAIGLTGALIGCNQESPNKKVSATQIEATDVSAHWLDQNWFVINKLDSANRFELYATDKDGNTTTIALSAKSLPERLLKPHLTSFFALNADGINAKKLIKSQLSIIQYDGNTPLKRSFVQIPNVLDALFTQDENDANEVNTYGAIVGKDSTSFTVWAPTATNVSVLVYDKDKQLQHTVPMAENSKLGTWQVTTDQVKEFDYYRYEIDVYHPASKRFEKLQVTDPYSLSLSTNSEYSQVINLESDDTKPQGWSEQTVLTVSAPEDLILYEMHIRDFSAADSSLSSTDFRGKYKAFSETQSHGVKHLKMLKEAGLNTLHLLPTYDLSTINEFAGKALDIEDSVAKMCEFENVAPYCDDKNIQNWSVKKLLTSFKEPSKAQALMEQIRGFDNYNWGYDPYHYTVPEGSYAVNPEGKERIIEFREMVQSIHNMGFRLIMDVVYNHTFASGLAEKSVLDKVVPGYYHRLNPISGVIENSTCCDNSATEHAMMEKLMIDSLVVWAKDYKIDGFRFDLMGHQPKDAMLRAREAVKQVDPDTYFYGEGWDFGEVANNAQFVQASQTELAGTEIGTFTDRLRDAVRGGNFQSHAEGLRRDQGMGNGLYVIPNELQPDDNQVDEYNLTVDQIRVGLAGNLTSYQFTNNQGKHVSGLDVTYGGSPAAYAHDPADTINYVSKHDNQTLWDNNQYRLANHLSAEQRVRMQSLSLAFPLLAQGIPFLHMGSELLRSKSFLRDSYDYGDWFNYVDFSYQTNNYDVGLPPAEKDKDNWPVIRTLLQNNGKRDDVTPAQIERSAKVFADFIKIRSSSPLFRLQTAEQVNQMVSFHNTGKTHKAGLIVMRLSDEAEIDANYDSIVVLFNSDDEAKQFAFESSGYSLHPAQKEGSDDVVKRASQKGNKFNVPAMTVAVFVK